MNCFLRTFSRDFNRAFSSLGRFTRAREGLGVWFRWGQWSSEARQRVFGPLFPFSATKSLGGRGVPANRFLVLPGLFLENSHLKSDHRIARLLEQVFEFPEGFGTVLRFSDAGLNLPPIGHGEAL